MTQKETKWSVHLEVMETQRYLCEIHTKIMETHRIFVWHSPKEKWDNSTQKKRQKGVAVHTIRTMYEIKGNKEVCSFKKQT